MAVLSTYALTTVADVKELLGLDSGDTAKDNLIIRKINQATDMIESWCLLPYNHHFKQTTYTNERYSGNGSNSIILGMRPVTSVTSFQYSNAGFNNDSWSDLETTEYAIDEDTGSLLLGFNTWGGWDAYRVTYTAGFSVIPSDLAEAAAQLAANLVEHAQTGQGVVSKTEGSRSITYAQSQNAKSLIEQLGIDDALNRYVMVSLGGV